MEEESTSPVAVWVALHSACKPRRNIWTEGNNSAKSCRNSSIFSSNTLIWPQISSLQGTPLNTKINRSKGSLTARRPRRKQNPLRSHGKKSSNRIVLRSGGLLPPNARRLRLPERIRHLKIRKGSQSASDSGRHQWDHEADHIPTTSQRMNMIISDSQTCY